MRRPQAPSPSFRVRLALLPTEQGGRHTAVRSGYRPNCWLGEVGGGERLYHDALFTLEEVSEIAPGETGIARLQPLYPDYWRDVTPGREAVVCEGRRVVGTAIVDEATASQQ